MSNEFQDRIALVTGAGDRIGLGFAHASYLAERGAKVVMNDFGNPTVSYAAAKSGLFGFTRTEAIFGQAHNNTANLLLPAAISRLTEELPESAFKSHLRAHFGAEKAAPVVAYLVSDRSEVTGETFTVGGGQFARIVYAASPAQEIDLTMESVAQGMALAMSTSDWTPQGSTAESLVHLGMPADLEQL